MVICDTDKLHEMVEEFCIEKRPKSMDIHRMINECTVNKHVLQPKEFEPNYLNDLEIENSIKLKIAIEVFNTILDEVEPTISIKQFLEHYMCVYGLTEDDILEARWNR